MALPLLLPGGPSLRPPSPHIDPHQHSRQMEGPFESNSRPNRTLTPVGQPMEEHMKSLLSLAAFAVAAILGAPAAAQSRNEVAALQYALMQHGLYTGRIDGKTGKGTQEAMKSFADLKGVESDFWSVASEMSINTFWESDWTDTVEVAVQSALHDALLDAESAKISDRLLFRTDDGASACVKLNAKNSFGAYTGYHWLYFSIVEINMPEPSPLNLKDRAYAIGPAQVGEQTSTTWCMIGYIITSREGM